MVAMVGTNNLKVEDSETIIDKYKVLVEEMKKVNCRKRTVIGILARSDVDGFTNRKRMGINMRLEQLCKVNDVDFMDPWKIYVNINGETPFRSEKIGLQILDRGGLHLNGWGQEKIAKLIFDHCVRSLN